MGPLLRGQPGGWYESAEGRVVSEHLIEKLKGLIQEGKIRQARSFLSSSKELKEDHKYFWFAAFLFLREEHPEVALEFAELGRKKFPDVLRFRSLLGMTFSKLERFHEARVELEAACQNRIPKVLTDAMSCVYLGLEDFEAGERFHARSREQDPDCLHRFEAYVSFLHDQGFILAEKYNRDEEAFRLFKKAEALAPKDRDVQYGLGATLVRMDRNQEAVEHLLEATERPPAWPLLAIAYIELGEFERALEASQKAVEHFPTRTDVHEYMARAARALRFTDIEVEALKEALRLSPHRSDIKGDLGLAYYVLGDLDEALGHLNQAIEDGFEENHEEVLAFWQRALVKVGLGDVEGFLDYDHAGALAPEVIEIKYNKARDQHRMGLQDQALKTLREILNEAPDDRYALELKAKIISSREARQSSST